METRLNYLLKKQILNDEEMDYVFENEHVSNYYNCGASGYFVGMTWFVVEIGDDEYNIYFKGFNDYVS